ncbi:MAG: protein kinase [Myxococcota bacterium]
MNLRLGDTLDGKYRIERVLGRGGMGTVYGARHTTIRRQVAVKVLRGAHAADDEMVQRFEREAVAASSVRSRHVVEVFDVGTLDSGERYMILEYLAGESMSQRLKRVGTMSVAEAFPLAAQLLDGLAAAHGAGIVHRDLKPANIFICYEEGADDLVKVLDFGVSKFSALSGEGFTQTGALVGTPHYMAPELTEGASGADARSDIYGVGAILFRALTGKTPYTAETIHELIAKLIRHDPKRLAEVAPHVTPEAARVVDRALAKNPDERYPSARAMGEDIRAVMARPEWLERIEHDDDAHPTVVPPRPEGSSGGASWGPTPPSWLEGNPNGAGAAALGKLGSSGRPAPRPPAPSRDEDGAKTTTERVRPAGLHATSDPAATGPVPPAHYDEARTVLHPGNLPEPPTLITPSPATLDSMLALPPRRSSRAWLVGVALGAVLAVGAGAFLFGATSTGAPTTAAPAENEDRSSSGDDPSPTDTPSSTNPRPGDATASSADEDAPDERASTETGKDDGDASVRPNADRPSQTDAPSPAATTRTPAPAARPRPPTPRRYRPPPPPPSGRDIREDL